jgi:hypothetical protein
MVAGFSGSKSAAKRVTRKIARVFALAARMRYEARVVQAKGRYMTIGLIGARSAIETMSRAVLGLALVAMLAACTTVEGTNALTDVGTFEREVMTSTAVGLGLVPEGPEKEDPGPRAPLALPANMAALPQPVDGVGAQLPEDRDEPQINVAGLSEVDLQRLRNARVVDLRSFSGRPLTEEEARKLTARMTAAGMNVSASGERPLYLPPEEYFTVVGGRDMVCQAPNGELVPLNDPRCPEEIREAIQSAGPQPTSSGTLGTNPTNWGDD